MAAKKSTINSEQRQNLISFTKRQSDIVNRTIFPFCPKWTPQCDPTAPQTPNSVNKDRLFAFDRHKKALKCTVIKYFYFVLVLFIIIKSREMSVRSHSPVQQLWRVLRFVRDTREAEVFPYKRRELFITTSSFTRGNGIFSVMCGFCGRNIL